MPTAPTTAALPRDTRPKLPPTSLRVRATWSVDQTTRARINSLAKQRGLRNGGRMLDADYGAK